MKQNFHLSKIFKNAGQENKSYPEELTTSPNPSKVMPKIEETRVSEPVFGNTKHHRERTKNSMELLYVKLA